MVKQIYLTNKLSSPGQRWPIINTKNTYLELSLFNKDWLLITWNHMIPCKLFVFDETL